MAQNLSSQVGKGYFNAKEALLLNGTFVVGHLRAVDARRGRGSSLAATLFTATLLDEVSSSALRPSGFMAHNRHDQEPAYH